jgi:hypothetical protein
MDSRPRGALSVGGTDDDSIPQVHPACRPVRSLPGDVGGVLVDRFGLGTNQSTPHSYPAVQDAKSRLHCQGCALLRAESGCFEFVLWLLRARTRASVPTGPGEVPVTRCVGMDAVGREQ